MAINETMDYKELLKPVKFQVIKKALSILLNDGFIPDLEISFFTDLSGVIIPDYLKKLYPEQMLIVLQHQFYNLKVFEDKFSIVLSFNRKQEQVVIPFFAITRFHDKISGDVLMFDKATDNLNDKNIEKTSNANIISLDELRGK